MRTIYKSKKLISIILLCFLMISPTFKEFETHAAAAAPVLTTPTQYQEFVYGDVITLRWTQPGDKPAKYLINVRKLAVGNGTVSELIVENAHTTNSYLKIFPSSLPPCSTYRVSVCAVYSNGTKKYSKETYFFVSTHNLNTKHPVSFKIWYSFETATKNAIYYSTRSWVNAIGYEAVNTYDFSKSYDGINSITKDGINAITGQSKGTNEYLMTTKCWDSPTDPIEFDINVNKSHPWSNSAQSGRYDVQSVMVHEIGHVLGLSHKYESFAEEWSMYGNGSMNSIKGRSLEPEDVNCLNDLY